MAQKGACPGSCEEGRAAGGRVSDAVVSDHRGGVQMLRDRGAPTRNKLARGSDHPRPCPSCPGPRDRGAQVRCGPTWRWPHRASPMSRPRSVLSGSAAAPPPGSAAAHPGQDAGVGGSLLPQGSGPGLGQEDLLEAQGHIQGEGDAGAGAGAGAGLAPRGAGWGALRWGALRGGRAGSGPGRVLRGELRGWDRGR